jgi:DNA-binding NarL/FixJ family response regulator
MGRCPPSVAHQKCSYKALKRKPLNKKRILIVDDHPMMRQGLAQLIDLEPDLSVVLQADTAGQALDLVSQNEIDLMLADIGLPDKSGLELIKDVQKMTPGLSILVVSMHDEALYAERVLKAGGRGYIMKQEGGKKLMLAIRQVLAGQIYVSEKMSARLLEVFSRGRTAEAASPLERLSDREFEVFELIGSGKGTREIAEQLHLSVKTVEVHRSHIRQKLNLQNGSEVVRYAIRWAESSSTK